MNRLHPWARAAAFALVLAAGGRARAQAVRPNILVVFDTSASMLDATGKDGSALCGGVGTTSRFYSLKKALREALAQVGTDEANLGLMRFPQLEDPMMAPACPNGHYKADEPNSCALSTHAGQTSYGSWFDAGYREALLVDVTRRPSPGPVAAAGDFDPPDANLPEVLKWIDLNEDAGTGMSIADPELRAFTGTPLARSLFYARLYIDNFVKPNDPMGACRQNVVLLATDGEEECDSKAGTVAADCSGGPDEFLAQRQACRLFAQSKIKTYVLTDTATGAANDAIAAAGGTGAAIRVTLTNTAAVKAALLSVIAENVPPAEECNGKDDNCNGLTDEGVSNSCPFDPIGLKHCAKELCNCKDDDCNGVIDDGFPKDACGNSYTCCAVPQELCNGLDDDCNGDVDEGFVTGGACDNGLKGACFKAGVVECTADGTGTFCNLPAAPDPSTELCNGVDDDCDGVTDVGAGGMPLPGEGMGCGSDLGTCKPGHTVCQDGKLVCTGTTGGTTETCNGIDDDCDGVTDDNPPGEGDACVCDGLDPAKADVGECHKGKLVCKGAMGLVCEGCGLPSAELCDGKDNDCDGVTDFNAPCPGGFKCTGGQCATACATGEFKCPACYKCSTDNFCIKQLCCGVQCQPGFLCDEKDGKCKDTCAGVTCEDPQRCVDGVCQDCTTLGCPQGQVCLAGSCQAPPKCDAITCGGDQYCDDGACKPLCFGVTCPVGQTCAAGACRDDKCEGVVCNRSQYCRPATGACVSDPCLVTQCMRGRVCIQETGMCVPDPCLQIRCTGGCDACHVTADGIAECFRDPKCVTRTNIGPRGGGGFGCAVAPATAAPARGEHGHDDGRGLSRLAGLLGLLALLAGRRRR